MRSLAHKVSSSLHEDYQRYLRHLAEAASRPDQDDPMFFLRIAENGLMAARLGYVFDAPLEEVITLLRRTLPSLIQVLEHGGSFEPGQIRVWLGAALLAKDDRVAEWIAELPRDVYTLQGMVVSEIAHSLTRAFQIGVYGTRSEFASRLQAAEQAFQRDAKSLGAKGEQTIQELLALLKAVAQADQGLLEQAWQRRFKSWKKEYSRPSKVADKRGLLDFEACAIGRIAQRYGLRVPAGNLYAPPELFNAAERA